jgi:DNA-binding response OmpR family regulator
MTFDARSPLDATTRLRRELARARRAVGTAESALERVLDHLDRAATQLAGTAGSGPPCPPRRSPPPLPRAPLPVATAVVVRSAQLAFVVHGVDYEIALSALRLDLTAMLMAPAGESSDALVEFKSTLSLVRRLRARGWDATRRSVIVEVSRLRAALGLNNAGLIETRRGDGYRFRVLRAVVPEDRTPSHDAGAQLRVGKP